MPMRIHRPDLYRHKVIKGLPVVARNERMLVDVARSRVPQALAACGGDRHGYAPPAAAAAFDACLHVHARRHRVLKAWHIGRGRRDTYAAAAELPRLAEPKVTCELCGVVGARVGGGDRRPLLGRVAHTGHDLEADCAPGGKSAIVDEHSVEHLGIRSPQDCVRCPAQREGARTVSSSLFAQVR